MKELIAALRKKENARRLEKGKKQNIIKEKSRRKYECNLASLAVWWTWEAYEEASWQCASSCVASRSDSLLCSCDTVAYSQGMTSHVVLYETYYNGMENVKFKVS